MEDGNIIYYHEDRGYKISNIDTNPEYKSANKIAELTSEIDYLVIASTGEYVDVPCIDYILNELESKNVKIHNVEYIATNHHIYHAYHAFYNSKFDKAVALIMDGYGSYLTDPRYSEIETIYKCTKDNIENVYGHYSSFYSVTKNHPTFINIKDSIATSNTLSCGMLFNELCAVLGLIDGRNAGKLMNLSTKSTKKITSSLWTTEKDNKLWFNNMVSNIRNLPTNNLSDQDKADIAKRLQYECKLITIDRIKLALDKVNTKNVVLSGGYFLNTLNNKEYIKEFPDINFYIDSKAYDAGTAIGAVYYMCKKLNLDFKAKEIDNG
jgi:predicted NodU family carbamoyl transferase